MATKCIGEKCGPWHDNNWGRLPIGLLDAVMWMLCDVLFSHVTQKSTAIHLIVNISTRGILYTNLLLQANRRSCGLFSGTIINDRY